MAAPPVYEKNPNHQPSPFDTTHPNPMAVFVQPPQGANYPPQGTNYPPQGTNYPPQGANYPPQGANYPPQGTNYPPHVPVYPMQPGAQQTIVNQQHQTVIVQGTPVLRRDPCSMICPKCHANIQTRVDYQIGISTWVAGVFIFVFSLGILFICAFIACCMDSFKDAVHFCPACGAKLGHGIRKRHRPGGDSWNSGGSASGGSGGDGGE